MQFPKIFHVRFAIQGIWTGIREETQVFWGFLCAFTMMGVALWREITQVEFAILLVLFGVVISLEMKNAAIERLCNKIEPKKDPDIKKIKDLASGAVLLISLVTLATWSLFCGFISL